MNTMKHTERNTIFSAGKAPRQILRNNLFPGRIWGGVVITCIILLSSGCSKDANPAGPPPPDGTPVELMLQGTTVTTATTFTATHAITAGAGFTVANGGSATLVTRDGLFYFRPGFAVVAGGSLRTIKNSGVTKSQVR